MFKVVINFLDFKQYQIQFFSYKEEELDNTVKKFKEYAKFVKNVRDDPNYEFDEVKNPDYLWISKRLIEMIDDTRWKIFDFTYHTKY